MIILPILKKDHSIRQHFSKLLEEETELNCEFMIMLNTGENRRNQIIEETLDIIEMGIGILDKFGATEEEIMQHYNKLKNRGWEFKDELCIISKKDMLKENLITKL